MFNKSFLKSKRAQMMSLDILFATILVILMFFILFNVVEAKTYETNSDKLSNELNSIFSQAILNIHSNPNISCVITDSNNFYAFPGCLSETYSDFSKKNLGIPDNFSCSLVGDGLSFTNNECNSTYENASEVLSIDLHLFVLVNEDHISKHDYFSYVLGVSQNPSSPKKITLRVWKDYE